MSVPEGISPYGCLHCLKYVHYREYCKDRGYYGHQTAYGIYAAEYSIEKQYDQQAAERCTVIDSFKKRSARLASVAFPVIKEVYETKGSMYENILVPITDGRHVYQISIPLKEAYETQGNSILVAFEKAILLHTIDDAWKENLRALDELKQSVQNASYEQKDPLLIFKLESVNLFDTMVNEINDGTISVLMRCSIPIAQERDVQQAPAAGMDEPKQHLTESHQNLDEPSETQRQQAQAAGTDTRARQPIAPIVNNGPKIGRNDPCPCGSGKKYKNCHGRGL